MTIKESRILRKIRMGDIKAFEELFHSFYPGMCSYAESLVNKNGVAEEVVQDVFYNIWKNKAELKINRSWQSYLYRSVFNNSMMYLRKAKRELSLDQQLEIHEPGADEQISEEMDARELNAIIGHTIQNLPERTQRIFKMSRFEGYKYHEIAEKLSISVKTVEANMGKALKALKLSVEGYKKTA